MSEKWPSIQIVQPAGNRVFAVPSPAGGGQAPRHGPLTLLAGSRGGVANSGLGDDCHAERDRPASRHDVLRWRQLHAHHSRRCKRAGDREPERRWPRIGGHNQLQRDAGFDRFLGLL